jgi:hypothetical protein
MILKEKLIKLKPDIIVEALNTSDIVDVALLGGAERFENVNHNPMIKIEPLYKHSHVFRGLLNSFKNYDETLINLTDFQEKRIKANEKILKQSQKTAEFCKLHGIPYFLIIHPIPTETLKLFRFHDYYGLFKNESFAFYTNEEFNNYFLERDLNRYYWKINGHYNSKGYSLMGDIFYEKLKNYICVK